MSFIAKPSNAHLNNSTCLKMLRLFQYRYINAACVSSLGFCTALMSAALDRPSSPRSGLGVRDAGISHLTCDMYDNLVPIQCFGFNLESDAFYIKSVQDNTKRARQTPRPACRHGNQDLIVTLSSQETPTHQREAA